MKPSERINRTYDLKRTEVEIYLASRTLQVPVTVSLELSSRPQIILSCEFASTDAAATNEINSKQQVNVRLCSGRIIQTRVGNRWELGGGKIRNILIPTSEPVTVLDRNTPLTRCKFALLNFPNVWGAKDIKHRSNAKGRWASYIFPRFQLEAYPWFVDVIATEDLLGVHYSITQRGGSALTHVGTITRSDGQDFSSNELGQFLEALHLFLSFVRGSYCGLTLLKGYDSKRSRVWEQWGTFKVEPWRRELTTWADPLNSLSDAFKGLWKLFGNPRIGEAISDVIQWYVRSSESIEPEVSIILNQAALERLAFNTMGKKKSRVKEGEWINKALSGKGIDTTLPSHCHELSRLRSKHNWAHGPHALVEMRNDLVHSDRKRGPFSDSALEEARSLGLHYVELMVLQLSAYSGQYINRLKIGQSYPSNLETVPWAPASSSTI